MAAIKVFIEKYLLIWLVLLSGLAFGWDGVASLFAKTAAALPAIIFVTMFAIGWMLPRDEVRQVYVRWPVVLGGTAVQYLSMPTLAYVLARQLQLPEPLFIGFMMVGCVPGAMASNVLTLTAGGNTSYSVSLTTAATMLSPLLVPLALRLTLGQTVAQDVFFKAAIDLGWMVVLPVIVGHLLSRSLPAFAKPATIIGSIVANLAILLIIAHVVAKNRRELAHLDVRLLAGLLSLNLLGYLAGYVSGKVMRLTDGMRRALTLEIGMQNAGLGTVLVVGLFPGESSVTVPTALYTFGCMLTGTVLARIWHTIPIDDRPA